MTNTTAKSMESILIMQRPERVNAKVAKSVKEGIKKACEALELSESQFLNIAVIEKLEKLNLL